MDVKALLAQNQERMRALYAGVDQTERYMRLADLFR